MELYSLLKCKTDLTGNAIIMQIFKVPEKRKSWYDSSAYYTLVTDFGNEFSVTEEELLENYECVGVEQNPAKRFNDQIVKINKVIADYFNEENRHEFKL